MVLELAALIVAIVNAVIAGGPIFSKLWAKIKGFFGGSSKTPSPPFMVQGPSFAECSVFTPESRLKASPQHLIEAHLRPLLQRDAQLFRETEAYYRPSAITQRSQWETWGAEDDAEWG